MERQRRCQIHRSRLDCIFTRQKSNCIIEGSLEVKLPTIWTDEKQSREEMGRGREKRKIRRKKSRRERVRRKKMQMREKVGRSRNTVFFQWFGAPDGRKVGSLKRRVRSQLARWEMKNCTPLLREAHLQNAQNTPRSDHFWKLRCRKSARRCGAKHISKSKCTKHTTSKCTKHTTFGPLLEVEMSKKWASLWRKAHFQVKMLKTLGVRTTFGGSDVASLPLATLHNITLHYALLHYTILHHTTLHNSTTTTTQPHSTTFHYAPLH